MPFSPSSKPKHRPGVVCASKSQLDETNMDLSQITSRDREHPSNVGAGGISHGKTAIATGIFSVLSLLLSLSLPHWVTTYETVPPTKQTPFHQELWDLDIHIGLFTVCPQLNLDNMPNFTLKSTVPKLSCASIPYHQLDSLVTHSMMGLWYPVTRTARVISRIRYCCVMAVISISLLVISSLLTILGHTTRTHFFMAASSCFTLSGLCLGSSLIMLVSAMSDEFNSTSVSQSESSKSVGYSYSWSFLFSLLSFLGCEISALLSFTAFRDQFGCQRDFLMIIPGMERKIAQVQLQRLSRDTTQSGVNLRQSGLETENGINREGPSSSCAPAPVDLLKCSFMHCPSPSSSIDTLTSRHVAPPISPPTAYMTRSSTGEDNTSYHQVGPGSTSMTSCGHTDHISSSSSPTHLPSVISSTQHITLISNTIGGNGEVSGSHPGGQHVLLSAKLDPDTDQSYGGVTLSRLTTTSTGPGTLNRLHSNNGGYFRNDVADQSELATFPRNKKKVTIIKNCNGTTHTYSPSQV